MSAVSTYEKIVTADLEDLNLQIDAASKDLEALVQRRDILLDIQAKAKAAPKGRRNAAEGGDE